MNLDTKEKDLIYNMIYSVLNDDHGVSEESFILIQNLVSQIDHEPLKELMLSIDATEGRFYVSD